MSEFIRELKRAARQFRNQPAFAVLVVGTLALTIGAAVTVFSLFDAVLLRPFPYSKPDRLVRLRTEERGIAGSKRGASLYDFFDWRERNRSFNDLAAYVTILNNLSASGPAQAVRMAFTTPSLFRILGVRPQIGQFFGDADDHLGANVYQAVLSYGLWQQAFAGNRNMVGQSIRLRGERYTVVGVLPAGFGYPDKSDVWVPLMARYSSYQQKWWQRRDYRLHAVIGRLRDDVTLDSARADMQAINALLERQFPDTNRKISALVDSLRDVETFVIRPYVLSIAVAVLLLLIIGCVNVANLILARATARQREFSIRAALGSSRLDIVRQLLAENLYFGMIGGIAGVLLSCVGLQTLLALIPEDLPAWMTIQIDGRVLSFAVFVSFSTVFLFGLAPLIQLSRADPNDALKQGSRGNAGASSWINSLRSGMIVAEVSLSVVLLVGAGLMIRSFRKVMNVDTGVNSGGLLVVSPQRFLPNTTVQQQLKGYADEFRKMRDRLSELPGVVSVSGGSDIPFLDQPEERHPFAVYTRKRAARDLAYRFPGKGADVMPGYFSSLGIPLITGRDFTEADTLRARLVVILSQHTAEILFPGQNAIGQEIRYGNDEASDPWMTVVGIVGNTKWQPAEHSKGYEIYWSFRQYPGPNMHLLIRTSIAPEALLAAVRSTLRTSHPEFAIQRLKPMTEILSESVWQRRLWGALLGTFAALAIGLASVGLYGVMSYLVTQRRREIGIRMAIGALRSTIVLSVIRSGLQLVALGIAVGLLAAIFAGRALQALLFGVGAIDFTTYAGVLAIICGVALIACLVPAWRASRIEPLEALREE